MNQNNGQDNGNSHSHSTRRSTGSHTTKTQTNNALTSKQPVIDFVANYSLSKLGQVVDSGAQMTDMEVLEVCIANPIKSPLPNFREPHLAQLKPKADNAMSLLISRLADLNIKYGEMTTDLTTVNWRTLVSPTLGRPSSYAFFRGPLNSDRQLISHSETFHLAYLSESALEIFCSQSIDCRSTWKYIRPMSPYFIIFNFYTDKLVRSKAITNMLTLDPSKYFQAITHFEDTLLFVYSLVLLLCHKLLPDALSEPVIEFLVFCFGTVRQQVPETAKFDNEFKFNCKWGNCFRISNSFHKPDVSLFIQKLYNVSETEIESLKLGNEQQKTIASFLENVNFPACISTLCCLI